MVGSLALAGVGSEAAVVVSVLFGLLTLVVGLVGGLGWLALAPRDRLAETPHPTEFETGAGLRVGVLGRGAVGGLLGLRLSSIGVPVVVVGRRPLPAGRQLEARLRDGTRLGPVSSQGEGPEALADVDVCLVAVKSRDTEAAAHALAEVLRDDAVVVSLQNGLRNPELLRAHLRGPVSQGVVGFNVVRDAAWVLLEASPGPVWLEDLGGEAGARLRRLRDQLTAAGQPVELREDIRPVADAKLLVNLNNAVGAVTRLGISDALRSRDARRCFARCVREGLRAGLRPGRVFGVPAGLLGWLLALPDPLVLPFARRLASMDPAARSSMLQDLDRGRPTEVDDLNGEVVRRCAAHGRSAPGNALLVELVHGIEELACAGRAWEALTPLALRRQMDARVRRERPTGTEATAP